MQNEIHTLETLGVLIDLNSARITPQTLEKLLEEAGLARIIFSKFYNFDTRRNKDFAPFIKANGTECAIPLTGRKKVRADIRLIIDAIKIACTKKPNRMLLVCGEIDLSPLITELKKMNIQVILGVEQESLTSAEADKCLLLERVPPAPSKTKKASSQKTAEPQQATESHAASTLSVDNFVDENGEIITDKLISAIKNSGLAESNKLTQIENLNKIKQAILDRL